MGTTKSAPVTEQVKEVIEDFVFRLIKFRHPRKWKINKYIYAIISSGSRELMEASPGVMSSPGGFLVELKGIVKRFPEVVANDHVDFQLRRGEIHALLGENGAGKTTLMNVFYGILRADSGEVYVKGKRVNIRSPKDAISLGIGMVHQHLKLVEPHTVVENIILGLKEEKFVLRIDQAAEKVRELSKKYGLEVDPYARVWQLSIGERQRVEILKVLYRKADILILDEPTSVLTPQETKELFLSLRRMADEGKGIIYITHKLREVFELSDRVTVMRKGRVVATKMTKETDDRELARMMVGRDVVFSIQKSPAIAGRERLIFDNVSALNDKGLLALRRVTLKVREGEILGIAGVAGNGQRELTEVATGLRPVTEGRILLDGMDITNASPRVIFEKGLAFIPEERVGVGSVPSASVAENLVLRCYRYSPYSSRGVLNRQAIRSRAAELIGKFNIVVPGVDTPARFLSGGNLQKLVLARELSGNTVSTSPKVIVASYPTRGLDVGATEYVQSLLLRYRDQGCAIMIVSEELDELTMICDRIAIMFEGRVMGVLEQKQFDVETIGLMMAGKKMQEAISG